MSQPRIAFLGTGLMGGPMAANLLKAGFPVTAWNRILAKAEAHGPGRAPDGRGPLLGRLPVRVKLDELTADDLVSILTQPREAMVPEYQRLCALDQIQLDFSHEALLEIANAALRQKLGARALRAILEKVLHPILFVAPERAGERILIEPLDVHRALSALVQ